MKTAAAREALEEYLGADQGFLKLHRAGLGAWAGGLEMAGPYLVGCHAPFAIPFDAWLGHGVPPWLAAHLGLSAAEGQ